MRSLFTVLLSASLATLAARHLSAQQKPRAQDFNVPIAGTRGPLNAITDVPGVEVGQTTLISGEGRRVVGRGPVRTGVTVVFPRGKASGDPVFGAWFTLNGNGEMTGTTWLEESGLLEGPVAITNTHSVGVVRDAILQWQVNKPGLQPWGLPVVAETYDGGLNDINGFHVTAAHTISALDGATGGRVAEGNVGGGTGMACFGFKGGIGTASRMLDATVGGYTVGVLVQCNFGERRDLSIGGVPFGSEVTDLLPCAATSDTSIRRGLRRCPGLGNVAPAPLARGEYDVDSGAGSIIVVVATDAPLLPHQLKRIATRVSLGAGRIGGLGQNSSGDIFIAFSTANRNFATDSLATLRMLQNDRLNPLFRATVQATEEAILNAMLAAETMTGADYLRFHALPVDRLRQSLEAHRRR